MTRLLAVLMLALLWSGAAGAGVKPDEILDDPVLEARARALGKQLRCLQCQNQSVDDSDAPLAADIRKLVRERLLAGDTDEEVKAFLVARYGEFILLRPPVRPATWLLWAGPFAVLILGGVAVGLYMRRRSARGESEIDDLSPEERARLERLLAGDTRPAG
ncbi:MAG TPA: cytochrome c-type biogenesis protein CcmH [Rhodospirillales bacterium]|nr:cytochrome c-type biogenesis protein CcmH [Rhodospirillales bacterium]